MAPLCLNGDIFSSSAFFLMVTVNTAHARAPLDLGVRAVADPPARITCNHPVDPASDHVYYWPQAVHYQHALPGARAWRYFAGHRRPRAGRAVPRNIRAPCAARAPAPAVRARTAAAW